MCIFISSEVSEKKKQTQKNIPNVAMMEERSHLPSYIYIYYNVVAYIGSSRYVCRIVDFMQCVAGEKFN